MALKKRITDCWCGRDRLRVVSASSYIHVGVLVGRDAIFAADCKGIGKAPHDICWDRKFAKTFLWHLLRRICIIGTHFACGSRCSLSIVTSPHSFYLLHTSTRKSLKKPITSCKTVRVARSDQKEPLNSHVSVHRTCSSTYSLNPRTPPILC